MFARRTPDSSRPLALAAAAALALGVGLAGPAGASSSSPTPAPSKVTFTVGILGDIDSANPFTGIVAEAYEIFQMEYPTLTEYSATDFSPAPGLAESWQESADKKTWTYKIRSGADVERRQAAHRQGRGVHLQPDHQRRVRAAPTSARTSRTSPRPRRPTTPRSS